MAFLKKKILIIDNSMYLTGALKSIVTGIDELTDYYEFQFCMPTGSLAGKYIESKKYKLHSINFLELSKSVRSFVYPFKLYFNAKHIKKIIKRENIYIIHVNDIYNMLGCYLKRENPTINLIYHIRLLKTSYIKLLYPFFAKRVKRFADKIICVSKSVNIEFGQLNKTTVIYDALSFKESLPIWNRLHNPSNAVFLYLANFINGKGQQYAIEAFSIVQKEFPNTQLHFVGDITGHASETFRKQLHQLSIEKGIEKNIHFFSKTNEVEYTLKNADIALMFSESESFSMVSLEAMLYGVPLIASNCGGPAEITNNGKMAQLVDNRDVNQMAKAMLALLRDPTYYKKLASEGKEYAAEKFSLQKSSEALLQQYNSFSK